MNSINTDKIGAIYKPLTTFESINHKVKNGLTDHPGKIILTGLFLTAVGFLVIGLTCSDSLKLTHNFRLPVIISSSVVGALGAATLIGVTYRWKHIPVYLICIPLLSLFGTEYCTTPLNQKNFVSKNCKADGEIYANLFEKDAVPLLRNIR